MEQVHFVATNDLRHLSEPSELRRIQDSISVPLPGRSEIWRLLLELCCLPAPLRPARHCEVRRSTWPEGDRWSRRSVSSFQYASRTRELGCSAEARRTTVAVVASAPAASTAFNTASSAAARFLGGIGCLSDRG